jgi:hypothetical protein
MTKLYNIFLLSILFFGIHHKNAFAKKNEPEAPAPNIFNAPVLQNKTTPQSSEKKIFWLVPDHMKIQFLRRAGHISAGAGYNIRDFYEPTLFVGYMYKQLKTRYGETPVITLKNSFTILGKNTSRKFALKGGFSINYSFDEIDSKSLVFFQRANYYFREKCYTMPFIGGEYYFNKNTRKAGIFAELSTVDSYLKDSFTSEFVQFDEIWAFRIGFSIYFHR